MNFFTRYSKGEILEETEILDRIIRYGRGRDLPEDRELTKFLINYLGSLDNVLSADLLYYKHLEGMNEQMAVLISLFQNMQYMINLENTADIKRITDTETAKRYMRARLILKRRETLYAVALNKRKRIIDSSVISEGAPGYLDVDTKKLLRFLLLTNAEYAIIGHNHPLAAAEPSMQDILVTQKLRHQLSSANIEMIDHIIVGKTSEYSLLTECKHPLLFC